MNTFAREEVIAAIKVNLTTAENEDIQKRRNILLCIYDVFLSNVNVFDPADPADRRLIQTMFAKAKTGLLSKDGKRDSRFEEYVHKFEKLLHDPQTATLKTQIGEVLDKIYTGSSTKYIQNTIANLDYEKARRLKRELNLLL